MHEEESYKATTLNEMLGVAVGTICAWASSYREHGEAGLKDKLRSKAGKAKLPIPVRDKIVELKRKLPELGCKKISQLLRRPLFLQASPVTVRRKLHE